MNDKETIKNKFIHFEPEVDDLVINQKWEKIKYFVPQKEEKKRGMIFFLMGTFILLFLTSALMLVTPLFPKAILDGYEKEKFVVQKNETATNTENNSDFKSRNQKSLIEKGEEKNTEGINTKNSSQQYNRTHTKKTTDKKEITKNLIASTAKKNEGNFLPIETAVSETKNESDKDLVTYDPLPLRSILLPMPEKKCEINISINPNYYLSKPLSPYSFDLLVGVQPVFTSITQNNLDQKNNSLNYTAGAAINYHLRNKFSLCGQFIFSHNNFNYKNTITENKILNQPISVSSTPMVFGDTVRYVHANTNYIIRSAISCNFALGAEYKFFQKNKLSLSAFSFFNVNASKYTYGYTRDFGKDVLVFIKGDPEPHPASNRVSSTFKEGEDLKEEMQVNTGIMPGILLGYTLNNKTSLIFKPACFIPFSENTFVINSLAFKLKENSLLLNFGLRINL